MIPFLIGFLLIISIKGLKVFTNYCSQNQLSDLLLSDSDYQSKLRSQVKANLLREKEEKAKLLQDQKLQSKQAEQLAKQQDKLVKQQAKASKKEINSMKINSQSEEKENISSLKSNVTVISLNYRYLERKRLPILILITRNN